MAASEPESLEASIDVDDGEEELESTVVAPSGTIEQVEDEPVSETLRLAADNEFERRTKLPVTHNHEGQTQSLWSVLKKNIGKKLSHIAMPVAFNEPLSALQHLAEDLEYSELLDEAASIDDAIERILLVAAFAVSTYGSSHYRSGRKPFNPILGETFQDVRPEKGYRFIAEQVSHHPPISVGVAESNLWTFFQEAGVRSSLRPSSLKITPQGFTTVTFPHLDAVYEWKKVVTHVEDIVSGNKWVDHHGKMFIIEKKSGLVCRVDMTQYSRFKKSQKFTVTGRVYQPSDGKKPLASFSGKWTEKLVNDANGRVLWQNQPPSQEAIQGNFGFGTLAMSLNQLPPENNGWRELLLPTDSRFRPDQRMWENAQEEQASEEKLRIEEIQRQARYKREEAQQGYDPRFFTLRKVPINLPKLPNGVPSPKEGERPEFLYRGGFWKQLREQAIPSIEALW